jgi:hypothetical protein
VLASAIAMNIRDSKRIAMCFFTAGLDRSHSGVLPQEKRACGSLGPRCRVGVTKMWCASIRIALNLALHPSLNRRMTSRISHVD